MKVVSAAWIVLGAGLLVSPAVHARPQTADRPALKIEIHAEAGDSGPRYTVTNISGKAVTAWALEFSISSQSKGGSKTIWDALLQNQVPLEPGASSSQYLAHAVGGPLPDKAEVLAGVWDDGETFGQPTWVKNILANRAMRESEYDQAVAVLRKGLEQNRNRDQYLQSLGGKPDSLPTHVIRSTLSGNPRSFEKPENLRREVQMALDSFTQKLERLRKAKRGANDGND